MTTLPAGWKPIESAPKNQLVMVYTPPQPSDWPDSVRIGFDYIDPEVADDYWYNHGEHYEHYCCVAKPENCTGPQERAPYTHWMPLPTAPGTPPASAQPERDWELTCDGCDGDGFVYVERRVGPCATDIQTFKEDCDCCEGRGFVFAFQDIPGIEEYVKACRPATADAPITVSLDPDPRGVSVGVWQGSRCIYNGAHAVPVGAQDDAKEYGSPADVAHRIEKYLAHDGRENSATLLLYEAMKALRAPAAGDAQDAMRWRSFRNAITQQDLGWLDRMDTALTAMGCDLDDETPPSADQVDAAADAAIAASQQQEG